MRHEGDEVRREIRTISHFLFSNNPTSISPWRNAGTTKWSDSRLQLFRLTANAGRTSFNPLTIPQGSLQVDMLLFVGGDIGVTAGEAVHRAAAADGACSSHNKR